MGEYADQQRQQVDKCIQSAYTPPEDDDEDEADNENVELREAETKNKIKIDAFLESLNHIIYCGHQDLPMCKTPEMLVKTQIAEAIRDSFMRIFEIPKEKIENYQPSDDMEVDAEDDCCDSDGYD